jgi:hypothetical protein
LTKDEETLLPSAASAGAGTGQVAVARHLLIHAFIMLRDEIDYAEFKLRGAEMRSTAQTIHRPNMPDHLIERPASV